MKKILILLVIFIMYKPLICQNPPPCGVFLDCSNEMTAHRYCDENKIITKCVQNPYTTEWGHPLRIPESSMPICLKFDNSGPEEVLGRWGSDCPPPNLDVFYKKSDFETDKKWAQDEWLCLCGIQDEECQCEVDIEFSENPSNFYYSGYLTSNNTLDLNPNDVVNGNCEIDCSKLKIYLNYTDEFCGVEKGSSGPYDHFFVSSCAEEHGPPEDSKHAWHYVNLKSVIEYQLAHIFGFAYFSDNEHSKPCFDANSIMQCDDITNEPHQDFCNSESENPFQIEKQDNCTFMKLYCPDLAATTVENEIPEKQSEGSLFYNKVNLTFQTNNFSIKVNIELYNLLGKKVMVLKEYNLEAGEHTISINSENLIPGIYFVTIKSENDSQIKKINIIK